jgi:WD40 repeat protein
LTVPAHADWTMAVAWSGDGQLLATAGRDKSAKVFDAVSGEVRVTYAGHEQVVSGVAFHPEGQQVYSGGADNKIHIWNVADGKKAAEIAGAGGEACKLVRGGVFLFAAAPDRIVKQLDAGTRTQVRTFSGHGEAVLAIAFHAGTRRRRGVRRHRACLERRRRQADLAIHRRSRIWEPPMNAGAEPTD